MVVLVADGEAEVQDGETSPARQHSSRKPRPEPRLRAAGSVTWFLVSSGSSSGPQAGDRSLLSGSIPHEKCRQGPWSHASSPLSGKCRIKPAQYRLKARIPFQFDPFDSTNE